MPLITHFSLRHGFMESKFSVTAASEALTAETLPQWTLMTLSHEIMHSRVRSIFQALFGKVWEDHEQSIISRSHFQDFCDWLRARRKPKKTKVLSSLRNVVLNFCYALEEYQRLAQGGRAQSPQAFSRQDLNEMLLQAQVFGDGAICAFSRLLFCVRPTTEDVYSVLVGFVDKGRRPLCASPRIFGQVTCNHCLRVLSWTRLRHLITLEAFSLMVSMPWTPSM